MKLLNIHDAVRLDDGITCLALGRVLPPTLDKQTAFKILCLKGIAPAFEKYISKYENYKAEGWRPMEAICSSSSCGKLKNDPAHMDFKIVVFTFKNENARTIDILWPEPDPFGTLKLFQPSQVAQFPHVRPKCSTWKGYEWLTLVLETAWTWPLSQITSCMLDMLDTSQRITVSIAYCSPYIRHIRIKHAQ